MSLKNTIILGLLIVGTATISAQNYFDDIYYNPKKDKNTTSTATVKQKESTYIANMGDMDVDAYNRRGEQYYVTQIDTIGSVVENGEDFVYTQQIQKFYNPTVVVDNANALGDVLSNARGNVDIVINNGYPVFAPYSYYSWNYPSYSVWSPWNWGFSIGGWGWSVGWYDPWYSWSWGPGWWNPGPGWWYPGPGWGPGPGPGPRPPRPGYYASWNPRGNRPVGPRPGWSIATQPNRNISAGRALVGNYRVGNAVASGGNRVTTGRTGNQPSANRQGVVNNNGRWQYNTSQPPTPTGGVKPSQNTQRPGATTGNRRVTPTTSNPGTAVPNSASNKSQSQSSGNKNSGVNNSRTTNRTSVGSSSSNRSSGSVSRSTGGATRSTGGRSSGGGGRRR